MLRRQPPRQPHLAMVALLAAMVALLAAMVSSALAQQGPRPLPEAIPADSPNGQPSRNDSAGGSNSATPGTGGANSSSAELANQGTEKTNYLEKFLGITDAPFNIHGWIQNSYTGNTNGRPKNDSNFSVFPNLPWPTRGRATNITWPSRSSSSQPT